jgi:hypothetical protein
LPGRCPERDFDAVSLYNPQHFQLLNKPKQLVGNELIEVVNLMDALRRSVEAGGERRKPAPRAGDHRAPKRAGRSNARAKKAG